MVKKTIKKIFIAILITGIGFAILEISRDRPGVILSSLIKESKLEGSEFAFRVKYLGFIPAGKVSFINKGIEDYQGKKVYHLLAQVNTSPYLASLFKTTATIDSYMDAEELHSLAFLQHLEISGKSDRDKEIIYDQKNNIMEFEGIRKLIYPHTQDCLSAIFYLQQQDFDIGKEFSLNINTNQKNYELRAKVLRKDEFKIGDKDISLWVLGASVRRRDGNPRNRLYFTVWLIDNPTKTPVLIKAMTRLGPITARLVDVTL